ncbi:PREDICTED: uncharacterized protein LOC105458779 [Wasmannia auropunctata]|uniref:uncharacterized protein LOC105458779 n=1 Tax=Wasmannia auropunctata TaxID=64793 RepID=UPI0005EEE6B8|nr:PREDICTED: uncharacterized protein LOC105458779 [Wasmannia auropunctata]
MSEAHFKAIREPNFLNMLASEKTSWHFIPPAAPHFGGLWEAGVWSVKHHLKRCIDTHTLTYEELTIVLCRIEACLNLRPIAAISENIDDALTPGHFLVGIPLIALREPSLFDYNENRLSRWQLTRQITEATPEVARRATSGQLVLVRNPLAPPSHWELERIRKCHYGSDGLTRVVTVQTSRSEYTRSIAKICFLRVDINQEVEASPATAG